MKPTTQFHFPAALSFAFTISEEYVTVPLELLEQTDDRPTTYCMHQLCKSCWKCQ